MTLLNNKKFVITIFISILFVYLFSMIYTVMSQRHFYADGAHFFLSFIRWNDFMKMSLSRQYGYYFTEFPVIFCLRYLHMEKFNMLSLIFGFGLYLPQIICLAICYHIVRNIDIRYMLFPLLSLFGITQNISFNMINDCLVLTYVFWPILFFIIFVREYNLVNFILLILMAFIFMRSYESASVLGCMLLTVLLFEMYQHWTTVHLQTKFIWVILALILLSSIVIATKELMTPIAPINKDSFVNGIPTVMHHYQALLSMLYIVLIAATLTLKKFDSSFYFKLSAAILFLITVYFSLIPLIKPEWSRPWLQHTARSFHLYMIPLLCILAYAVLKGPVRISDKAWQKAFMLCAFLVAGQLTWQILMTAQWNGFRHIFREELSIHEGYVRFEDTRLVHRKIGNQLVGDMTWGWTNPTLSILWSNHSDIRTIIANPVRCLWEPFDPRDIRALPKIERYGFTYEKYIEKIKSHNK